jgi:maleylacetate reductase
MTGATHSTDSMSLGSFVHQQFASRVIFGVGSVEHVARELDLLRATRVFLIADGSASKVGDHIAVQLGERLAAHWNEVVQHVPMELAERARASATEHQADVIVSIGGGSATGLAKAIALSHRLPIIAIPTTYAGSEQTSIYGMTGDRHKATGRDPIVVPTVVIYDPALTTGLPPGVTGPSAFNGLAHSVEALYATGANPVTAALALEGITAIHRHLPGAMQNGEDLEARSGLLYGAYLSGLALGTTSAGLHHKICHVLGGTFNMVHADAHSVLLPHVTAFNAGSIGELGDRLARALGTSGAAQAGAALWDLAVASKVPTSLEALGLRADNLDEAADRVMAELPPNPRTVNRSDVSDLLNAAFAGSRPSNSRPTPGATT